jgi:predicted flap endonuclease-1-like 5' DNA nuclease
MGKLSEIEGIGAAYSEKLAAAGIKSQEKLLEAGGTPKGRKDLAAKTDISGKLILKWVNRADLARVKGVGEEYADLLEFAGVDTVPELAQRRADNLLKKMLEVNEQRKLVRSPPTLAMVEKWIAQAKTLPRAIHY